MKLYLMRHGIANHPAVDPMVGLSDIGQIQTKEMAKIFQKRGTAVEEFWFSPKTRAQQTAGIVMASVKYNHKHLKHDIVPEGHYENVAKHINEIDKDIFIVSHLPFIPNLVNHLIPDVHGKVNMYTVVNSSVHVLEKINNNWQLVEIINP